VGFGTVIIKTFPIHDFFNAIRLAPMTIDAIRPTNASPPTAGGIYPFNSCLSQVDGCPAESILFIPFRHLYISSVWLTHAIKIAHQAMGKAA
jgi:hypothetical protein